MLHINIKSFAYPNSKKEILSQISFQLKKGEHLSILGESGCGKSSLLHLIYGLLDLDYGSILYKEKPLFGPIRNLIPGHSFMKLVSQETDLMPYTSVEENVAEHLSRLNTDEDAKRVRELLDTVGLLPYKDQKIKYLSGGQKQRVALAKALAKQPEILLLDEPFSSIDTFKKNQLRRNLFTYLKHHNISCIMATHDTDEALAFADNLALLEKGTVIRYGSPELVYKQANTVYERGFFGEVSVISSGIFSEKEQLFLPHELSISKEKTSLKMSVENHYFKGSHYLVEGNFRGEKIYCNHPTSVTTAEAYLKLTSDGK